MADYVRITNMNSQNLIGKNPFGGDRLFEREYKQGLIKEAEKMGTKLDLDINCAMITYLMRMSGVPTNVVPSAYFVDDIKKYAEKKKRMLKRGDIISTGDIVFITALNSLTGKPEIRLGYIMDGYDVPADKLKIMMVNTAAMKMEDQNIIVRTMMKRSDFIVNVFHPDYNMKLTKTTERGVYMLSKLIKPTRIAMFQSFMKDRFKYQTFVTGEVDANFKQACIINWKELCNASKKTKLVLDTTFGDDEIAACGKWTINRASCNKMVYMIQGLLYGHGYDPKGFNGRMGVDTCNALELFVKSRKLDVDEGEIINPKVWVSLLTKW